MSTLIGLYSSVMGSGKTALTDELERHALFTSVKFAGTLKSMIRRLLEDAGIEEPWRYTDGDLKETVIPFFGVTCRHMMQTLGTDWGRALIKPTLWIDVAKARISSLMAAGLSVVVDDVRFPNEFQAIKDLGGTMCRVIRPGLQDTTGHASEGALDAYRFDLVLPNVGSLEDWQGVAGWLVQKLAEPVEAG
jgi:hypothetical protein